VLRESEQHLRDVIETIPATAWTGRPDGTNDFVNRRCEEYTGLSLQDRSDFDWISALHPDDVATHVEKWRESVVTGTPFENEARLRRASDGQYRWFLHRGVPLRNQQGEIVKWYGTGIDIEDRKRAEEALRESEKSVRLIVDGIAGLVAIMSAEGKVEFVNNQTLQYFGRTREELEGWATSDVVHPDDLPKAVAAWTHSVATGEPYDIDHRLRRADGVYRWFNSRGLSLRDAHGRIIRWYNLLTDIEDRRRTEEKLLGENLALREHIDQALMFEEIVGESPALRSVLARLAKVAPTESTVLITGETGTGKELIARAIHKRSHRSARAFVCVNCAAVPSSLITSELFGHEKGAFTGATQRRLGRFELAEGGTLFLDEVGELPSETKIALLRVVQEREFERLEGTKPIRANVRVIAATNRDLVDSIEAGTFRRDLYYRLNVFPIEMPPLRERKEDIPLLVEYFIHRYASRAGKSIRSIDREALARLTSYAWPGNIRELQNVIERSIIVCDTESFTVDECWLSRAAGQTGQPDRPLQSIPTFEEKRVIEVALAEASGQVSGPNGAAARLGIPASTLESKIKALKINKHRYRSL
jgi:PAS domain S-box-containing protein